MTILSGRKVETHEPGTLGSFGAWRDPRELETLADHAHRYYGRATPLDELELHDGLYVNRSDGTLLYQADSDPLAAIDPSTQNVETWTRRDDGTVLFLRRPHRNEPQTLTEIQNQQAAAKRALVDAEKARLRFLKGQELRPVLRQDAGMTLREALETVEHHEGRIELGPYGEIVVAVPGRLTPPGEDPFGEGEARQAITAAAEVIIHCAPVIRALLERQKKGERLSDLCPAGAVTAGGGIST